MERSEWGTFRVERSLGVSPEIEEQHPIEEKGAQTADPIEEQHPIEEKGA
jgi:hypothetical protein